MTRVHVAAEATVSRGIIFELFCPTLVALWQWLQRVAREKAVSGKAEITELGHEACLLTVRSVRSHSWLGALTVSSLWAAPW